MSAKSLSVVVLAAGRSSRMGQQNKLLLDVGGRPLIRKSVEMALACAPRELCVVVGHEAPAVCAALAGLEVRTVINPDPDQGQQSSVRLGLGALREASDGVLVCLGDQAWLTVSDLDALTRAFLARGSAWAVVPRYQGAPGNPVALAWEAVWASLSAEGNYACRKFLEGNPDRVLSWEAPNDHYTRDVDTPEDYAQWERSAEAGDLK